jgi:hypothetical protein
MTPNHMKSCVEPTADTSNVSVPQTTGSIQHSIYIRICVVALIKSRITQEDSITVCTNEHFCIM